MAVDKAAAMVMPSEMNARVVAGHPGGPVAG